MQLLIALSQLSWVGFGALVGMGAVMDGLSDGKTGLYVYVGLVPMWNVPSVVVVVVGRKCPL